MTTRTTDPTRYFLGSAIEPNRWVEVTKSDFVRAEHAAGFHGPRRDEPATAGFSGSGGSEGTVRYDGSLPDGTVIELVKATAETTPTGTPDQDAALRSAITEVLGPPGDYRVLTCTRVWEAWGYGTMTEDDFTEACQDDEVITDLVHAVAPLLAAARREGAVQALREAAVSLRDNDGYERVYAGILNHRADAIEAEGSPS